MPGTGEEQRAVPLLKNRYQLGRVLGRGGMCIVYQAWDTRQQRFVAIKRLEPPLNEDPRTRARFDREGRALALLDHPNLVALLDRGSSENDDYLVFEYVDGRSLKELIREGHISIEAFGVLVGQVAEGLASAHSVGIVHRDVKPQNILIDRLGHAKVSDFGIATGPDWTRVTRAGAVIGSARYMSPEQIRSKPVDARSDVYSLGVVMYEMLSGHTPFDGNNMPEIARQHLQAEPPPLTDTRAKLPPGLEAMIMKCLEKDPDDRFESMEELIGALVALGLYRLKNEVEETGTHRWSLRRSNTDEAVAVDLSSEYERPPSARSSKSRSQRGRSSRERESGAGASRESSGEPDDERYLAREQARAVARKRRKAKRRRLALGAGVLVALLVIIIVTLTTCGSGPAPDLAGKSWEEASELADSAGLTLVPIEQPSFQAVGTILSQDPLPGIKSEDGTITVEVAREPIAVQVNRVAAADPDGDQLENDAQIGNLIDGNPDTSWSTEAYKSPSIAGAIYPNKHGVGFLFSLAEEASLVRLTYTLTGWSGQIQVQTTDGTWVGVAEIGQGQDAYLSEPIAVGRVWFTALAQLPNSDRYGVIINEIAFYK